MGAVSVSNNPDSLDDVKQRILARKDLLRFTHSSCSHSVRGVLEDDHGELAVRSNHNLVDGRADLYESDFFLGMKRLNSVVGFVHEIPNETTVIDCLVLIHGTLNCNSFFVDDDHTEDAHVRIDAIQRFFNFL